MEAKRAALICDYLEEGWLSMDVCAQMLERHWRQNSTWQLRQICPPFRRRLTRLPKLASHHTAFNSDRLLNRFWDYPNYIRSYVSSRFDIYHVCDHTYAQLVHALPAERTGVYCHDMDAFRSLVEPEREPRPRWYRAMSQRILDGLQKAAIVFYSTHAVREQLESYQLVERDRLIYAPYGTDPEFSAIADPQPQFQHLDGVPFLLHVGSCVPRKRIDVLLDVFAQLQQRHPNLRLIKVSGEWSADQREQIDRLGIQPQLEQFHNLSTPAIADLYRRASVVLLTSASEGFGLPLIEALACGAIAVVSDLPVLREVGGNAALYCPVGEIPAWVGTIDRILRNADCAPGRSLRLNRASQFSWKTHTDTITQAYESLGIKPVVVMR